MCFQFGSNLIKKVLDFGWEFPKRDCRFGLEKLLETRIFPGIPTERGFHLL